MLDQLTLHKILLWDSPLGLTLVDMALHQRDRVQQLQGRVQQLQGKVQQLRGGVQQLRGRVQQLPGKGQQLQDMVQQLQDTVDPHLGRVLGYTAGWDSLKGKRILSRYN